MPFLCDKTFMGMVIIRFCEQKKIALIWAQFESMDWFESLIFQPNCLNYKLEVQGPENKISFEGPVRNIDEKIDNIVESQNGLTIPFANIKKCLQEERLHFSVEIRNLKSNKAV